MSKKETPWKRFCPKCEKEMYYCNESKLRYAVINNLSCVSCSHKKIDSSINRNCPKCGKELTYKNKYMRRRAEMLGVKCCSCNIKEQWNSEEFRRMHMQVLKTVGISGTYKGHHFRSRLELYYIIEVLEPNHVWESGEKFAIPYMFEGKKHLYHPDFFIDNKKIVEIKMSQQMTSPVVLAKSLAAEKWCNDRGYSFEIIDPRDDNFYTFAKIAQMYQDNEITLNKISPYIQKFI